jgi:uncharacterized Tic20 family protein
MDTPPPAPNSDPSPAPLPPQPPAPGGASEQQWIVFLHLSAFAGIVLPSFGHILGPLIIWLIKKPESPAIDVAGRNVLNFQISWTIYGIIAGLSFFFCVGAFLFPAVVVAWLIFTIIGAVKASNGETYKFPLTIKML